MSMLDLDKWNMDGQIMMSLSEPDFLQRLPQGGDTVYAQFDMWRSNAAYHYPPGHLQLRPEVRAAPLPGLRLGPR